MVKLDDYVPIVRQSVVDDLRLLSERLKGKVIQNINSTAVGGGVAEILNRMVPLLKELGVDARWDLIKGGQQFFDVTKKFHNVLHGREEPIEQKDFDIFLEASRLNIEELNTYGDIVYIHDPQPIALVVKKSGNKWIWRCHIDVSNGIFLKVLLSSMTLRYSLHPCFPRSFQYLNSLPLLQLTP